MSFLKLSMVHVVATHPHGTFTHSYTPTVIEQLLFTKDQLWSFVSSSYNLRESNEKTVASSGGQCSGIYYNSAWFNVPDSVSNHQRVHSHYINPRERDFCDSRLPPPDYTLQSLCYSSVTIE